MPTVRTPLPTRSERPPTRARLTSRVLIHTGDGKGKTSSAMGVLIRGWARGWRVAAVQFMKGGEWHSGERIAADKLGIEWHTLGDGFTWDSEDLDESAAKNVHAWQVARDKLASGDYDLIVLDELTYLINYGWIEAAEVVDGIENRARGTNVVITGRHAPEELVELADTVSEMRLVKHAYEQGVPAKKGIEY